MFSYSPPRYLFRRHTILKHTRGGNKFIEIGAGNLRLSADLLKHYKHGVCLDFAKGSKKYHDQLPAHKRSRLKLIIGDFFKQPFSRKYDCLIACEVMEHIEDDRGFLRKCNDALENQGQLILSVPAKMKYWTVHDEIVGHYKRYEKNELNQLLEESGFMNIRVISYGYPFLNFLWVLRKLLAIQQARTKSNWSKEKQTKESGINQIPKTFNILWLFANKYVFFVPNLISGVFERADLSEGYIVIADKT